MSAVATPPPAASATRPARKRVPYVRQPKPTEGRRVKKSIVLTIVMAIFVIYSIVPLVWLIVNATKDQGDLFSSFGLWFGSDFNLFQNIYETVTYRDGIFVQWFGNTLLYVVVGAGGATLLATIAGYGMAKFNFPGRKAVFAVVLGAVAIPGTAMAPRTIANTARRPGNANFAMP